jgi:hypothetical protein
MTNALRLAERAVEEVDLDSTTLTFDESVIELLPEVALTVSVDEEVEDEVEELLSFLAQPIKTKLIIPNKGSK